VRLYVWARVRRALVVAFVSVFAVVWLAAPASGNRALALVAIVLGWGYIVGAVAATVSYTRWVRRHKERVVVSAVVAGRFRVWPRLWAYKRVGNIEYLSWLMPTGMTLSQLVRWREMFEQAFDRGVDWWYDAGLYHMRVITGEVPARMGFSEFYGGQAPAGELVFGVGMARMGPVWADLASLPHLLIGGVTGAGKSVFMRQLVTALVLANGPERLRLGFIDLKGGMEMNVFMGLPHRLGPVLREWQACGALLEELNAHLDGRQAAFEAAGVVSLAEWNERHPGAMLPYLVLVIDETAELTAVESPDRAERASRQAQLASLTRICRLGRAAGVHVLAATQRPDAEAVPGQLKANLPATMAFRVRDPVNSRILLGDGNPQAASLPAIAGRGIWQTGDVQAEVQTPWLDRREATELLENRSQAATTSGRAGGTEPVTRCPQIPQGGRSAVVR
jgi:S-DNA-T family DNA segregation ATPase FtsK/SpoIIIE